MSGVICISLGAEAGAYAHLVQPLIENLSGLESQALASSAVDVIHLNWSGTWPGNRAPQVTSMTINSGRADQDIRLDPGSPMAARVMAYDPENDPLGYYWELLEEPNLLGSGGSYEPRPSAWGRVVQGVMPMLELQAPDKPGEYRLFVYVLDQNGHVGTANTPFRIESHQVRESDGHSNASGPG